MKSHNIDLKKLACALQEHCPFIVFAILTDQAEEQRTGGKECAEISVFVSTQAGAWNVLEQVIAAVAETLQGTCFDVALLNHADAFTRYKAARKPVLFVRDQSEHLYQRFSHRASLDYRILLARGRRQGITGTR